MAPKKSKQLAKERLSEKAMRLAAEEGRKRRETRDEEAEEETVPQRRAPGPPRISITIDVKLRKKIRLAAALADMEEGDWARTVLVTAAKRTVEKVYGTDIAEGGAIVPAEL